MGRVYTLTISKARKDNKMEATTNQPTTTTLQDRILRIAEAAEGYAKDVTEDYIGDWERTLQAKPQHAAGSLADEANSTAGAFAHAAAWLRLAEDLRKATGDNKGMVEIAQGVREVIKAAGNDADIADWGCVTSIAKDLKEAAEDAIREAHHH